MSVIYTKSALKKIKKDDLIDIYLSQQKTMSQFTNQYETYACSHPCEMNCKHCGLTTTEDDLGISLECGELTCEGCFSEGKSKNIKEENKELKDLCDKQVKSYSSSVSRCGKYEEGLDKWMESHAKWVKRAALLKVEKEELKEELEDAKEEYWEKGWHGGKCDTFDEIDDAVKPLKEEINKLKQFKSEVIEAMKYDDDLDDEDIIKGIRDMEEDIVGESELKEEAATNQRRATMYQFMSEYMEEADCMGEYFDYIRENYPDKQKEAGVLSD